MAENVSISMPDELVRPIIEAKVAAAVAAAIGNSDEIIQSMVSAAMNSKVSSDGKVSDYSHYNTFTFLDILCKQAIQDYARAALKKWLEDSKPKIEAAIKKHLDKKTNELAAHTVQAMIDRTSLNVEFATTAKFSNYDS